MSNIPIRLVLILGSLALAGIIATQVFWASRAISSREQQFSHSVKMALRNVTESICEVNGVDVPVSDPIEQVSNNYFIVRTNSKIDLRSLEYLLKAELEKRELSENFEYGVYDCQTDEMVYGNLVNFDLEKGQAAQGDFPKLMEQDYYFGVFFPEKEANPLWGIDIWKLTTVLTVFVIIFFAFAMATILKQKRLSSIQRDFVNNIMHEFKTPLSTLKVASTVLEESDFSDPTRAHKYASVIKKESERLEKQVGQLLTSAVIEDAEKIEISPVNIRDLLKNIVNLVQEKKPEVKIETDIPEGLPLILGNVDLAESVFYNLTDNASKYGKGWVKVAVRETSNHVSVDVIDNGPGIPKNLQKKVFQKFFRISQGDRHDVKGFGLGLFVVQKAVKQMKGSISIKCEKGCCFTVKLPKI